MTFTDARTHFDEIVAAAGTRRTVIEKRGQPIAVVIGPAELAELDALRTTGGARVLARLAAWRRATGGVEGWTPEPALISPESPFDPAPKPRRRRR